MNWYQQHRQDWIEEMLSVYGFINREHLVRKFGISVPQASMDLTTFSRLNHGGALDAWTVYRPGTPS